MLRNIKSDYLNWIILIGILLLLLEILFFNGGLIVTFLLSIGCIYLGRRWKPRFIGKCLYGLGWIWLVMTVFNMMTFRYFLCVLLIYAVIQFFQTQKVPKKVKPIVLEPTDSPDEDGRSPKISRRKIFKNTFFENQKSPDAAYEWNDVNIQVGIGNTVIDLSDTVLPNEEAIISIRSLIGNVQVFIPYEVEVHIHHSALVGDVTIFQDVKQKIVNETLMYETPQYRQGEQRVKLITSALSGKLEVKRI